MKNEMTTTIILHSSNKNGNSFNDTIFNIHVPLQEQLYSLQLQSFMFRPQFLILTQNDFITVSLRFKYIDKLNTGTDKLPSYLLRQFTREITFHCKDLLFNGSSFDDQTLNKMLLLGVNAHLGTHGEMHQITMYPVYLEETNQIAISFGCTCYLSETKYFTYFVTEIKILGITKRLSHITGLKEGQTDKLTIEQLKEVESEDDRLYLVANEIYRPYYFNLITLHCNKAINIGRIINQTKQETYLEDTACFHDYSILGYLPNCCSGPYQIASGLPTNNEYLIQPHDFNMIRFSLKFDNNEPVELLSPMTIIVNLIPLKSLK